MKVQPLFLWVMGYKLRATVLELSDRPDKINLFLPMYHSCYACFFWMLRRFRSFA
ncbi:MAG: hypothetical protein IKD09_03375 [Lentisphaeria bacterium]|nr:hypothetical protein [Lentisphaeria bacterium]